MTSSYTAVPPHGPLKERHLPGLSGDVDALVAAVLLQRQRRTGGLVQVRRIGLAAEVFIVVVGRIKVDGKLAVSHKVQEILQAGCGYAHI
jgi:hypothetical protein